MDYEQIKGVIWDTARAFISISAIREICLYFKTAGKLFVDKQTIQEIQKNGEIMLSLDGAQPKKGNPALWIFSDRITMKLIVISLLV